VSRGLRPSPAAATALALWLGLLAADAGRADAAAEDAAPGAGSDAALSGDDIYRKVVENRFRSFEQETVLTSGDRGGNEQETRLEMTWKDWRGPDDGPVDGYYSKTRIVYTAPFDLRYTAYLISQRVEPPNDQFLYLPSSRRTRRVNLRGESIFGTDFSFEDVVPREFEDATYRRLPDAEVEGVTTWVVEATPKPETDSEYSRFVLFVDKERHVPLRTRYYDADGTEVKELRSPPGRVREFDGVHVPMESTMRNLQLDTYTVAEILDLEPNPELRRGTFDLRRLEGH